MEVSGCLQVTLTLGAAAGALLGGTDRPHVAPPGVRSLWGSLAVNMLVRSPL